ncbi:MAG TPA: HlyD family efflux transporter periplasmic adaptor subunit [Myxococcales bacterium]|jgi:membrane fusion protein (multidrug efflux system)
MAYPFQRTLRSLNGDEFGIRVALMALSVAAIAGLGIWAFEARIPVLKVSTLGRIEPHNAVHRIEPPEAGKVLTSTLALDREVAQGDLLVEFDSQEQRFELQQSEINLSALTHDLAALTDQIARKKKELAESVQADEAALREAEAKSRELTPKYLLAQQRERRAEASAPGAISEMEKLERKMESEELSRTTQTQPIALRRLQREQTVRRAAIEGQLLQFNRDRLKLESDIDGLQVTIAKLRYQIGRRQVRAPATGQLVDVVELAEGDYISQGQRLGTILAKGPLRVRARFPKETVGIIRPGQMAQLKLDGYPWSVYGTVPAQVTSVGTEPTVIPTAEAVPGTVKVELDVQPPGDPRIVLQHGMTATVEIEVARVSPIVLLLRAIGEWNYAAPAAPPPGSPDNNTTDKRAQNDGVALAPPR